MEAPRALERSSPTHKPRPRFTSVEEPGPGVIVKELRAPKKSFEKRGSTPVPRALILVVGSLKDGKFPSCNRKSFANPSTHREKGLPQQRRDINKGQVGGGRTTEVGGTEGRGGRMGCKR